MRASLDRLSIPLPVLTIGIVGGIAVWKRLVAPGSGPVIVGAAFYCAILLIAEYRWRAFPRRAADEQRRFVRTFSFAVALVFLIRNGADLIDATHPIDGSWRILCHRVSGMLFGAALAVMGNFLPKLVSPWSLAEEPFDWQSVHRFVGWVFVIAGTLTFLGWLALLPQDANRLAVLAMLAASILAVGRKLYSLATWKTAR